MAGLPPKTVPLIMTVAQGSTGRWPVGKHLIAATEAVRFLNPFSETFDLAFLRASPEHLAFYVRVGEKAWWLRAAGALSHLWLSERARYRRASILLGAAHASQDLIEAFLDLLDPLTQALELP